MVSGTLKCMRTSLYITIQLKRTPIEHDLKIQHNNNVAYGIEKGKTRRKRRFIFLFFSQSRFFLSLSFRFSRLSFVFPILQTGIRVEYVCMCVCECVCVCDSVEIKPFSERMITIEWVSGEFQPSKNMGKSQDKNRFFLRQQF